MAKILIVDDEPRIRELIHEHLQYSGYICEEAGDGSAALAQLSGGGFDLVILDRMMTGVLMWRARISRRQVMPSMNGIIRSRMTRSKAPPESCVSAAVPSAASSQM